MRCSREDMAGRNDVAFCPQFTHLAEGEPQAEDAALLQRRSREAVST
jgi:hypothetical protein